MSKKTQAMPVAETRGDAKYRFHLLIGYEDAATRNRALHLYDRLAQQLLAEYDFRCAWWKFDHLREERLMARAIDDALEANMILLSFTARHGLPVIGRTWLEAWAGKKARGKRALVAMIDECGAATLESGQIESYLRQTADRANMDFFFHVTGHSRERHVYTVETLVQRACTVTPLLQEILQRKSLAPRISLN